MEITAQLLPSREFSQANFSISVSKAKTFDHCKAQYKFAYIEKLPRKEWDHHVFGKYLHSILESFHDKLLNVNSDIDKVSLMTECIKEADIEYKDKIKPNQLSEAEGIIESYLDLIKTQKREGTGPIVTAVEKAFYIDIAGKVLLNGFIDRVQTDYDGVVHVADYKTTKDKKFLKDYFQLETYAFALMLNDPGLQMIRASYIMLRHNCEFLTKEFTREEVMGVKDKFVSYVEQIEAERLWRPNPQFLCKFCDWVDICESGKGFLVKKGFIKKPSFGLSEW